MSLAKLRVLTSSRFSHDHDVLELKIVLEFRLFFRRDATVSGAFDQLRHALSNTGGRAECDYALRRCTCRDKINNFVVGLGRVHSAIPAYR
jgi:hypothetical protein